MGSVWTWLKHLFSKTDNSINTDNSTKIDKSIKVKQRDNGVVDMSQNKTHIDKQYNTFGEETNKFIVLKMRWNHLVPHEIVEKKNGPDAFSVLEPVDKNFLKTKDYINLSNGCNNFHGLYILCKENPNIANFGIKQLIIKTDKNDFIFDMNKSVSGLLDCDKAFIVNHKELTEGSGEISMTIFYTKNSVKYNQTFVFSAQKNSSEFVLREYNNPEQVA